MNKPWTTENIKAGFDKFAKEHGRLPKALEIDQLSYLPTSRFIQQKFGGLEKLRAELGYEFTHFGKGVFRSEIANRVNKRGRDAELSLENSLRRKFGEVFVHTEKIFDFSKNRVDFYVYSPSGNFGIDVFYPDSLRSMQSNVNIKLNKYTNFKERLFLVVANENLDEVALEKYSNSKSKLFKNDTQIISLQKFLKIINTMTAYPNPLPGVDTK